jgi:sulfate transport system permease protein
MGIIISWVLVRQRFRGKRILNLLVDIPFVFSPVIAGYTMIVLFGRNGWLTPTTFPIVFALPGILLAKTFVSLPFVTREVGPVLAALDREPEDAAYTIGASRWLTFRRIILPNIWPGILYGIILTLARALGEFGAVAVVSGGIEGQTETATMYVFRALNDRNNIGAYSMSLLLGLVAILVLVLMRLIRRGIVREDTVHVNQTG